MSKQEAKKILHAYRPDPTIGDNPAVVEAIRLAEEDPDLQEYLAQEQAFDRAFAQKLREIEPPTNLLKCLLEDGPTPTLLSKGRGWKQSYTWSIAAGFLILMSIGILFMKPHPTDPKEPVYKPFDQFIHTVVEHATTPKRMQYYGSEREAIHAFLAEQGAPVPHNFPDKLNGLQSVGCLSFPWRESRIGVICFKGEKLYHLYIADRAEVVIERKQPTPTLWQFGDHAAAVWTKDSQIFVLTVKGQTDDLSQLL